MSGRPYCKKCERPVDACFTNIAMDLIVACHGERLTFKFHEKVPRSVFGMTGRPHPQEDGRAPNAGIKTEARHNPGRRV